MAAWSESGLKQSVCSALAAIRRNDPSVEHAQTGCAAACARPFCAGKRCAAHPKSGRQAENARPAAQQHRVKPVKREERFKNEYIHVVVSVGFGRLRYCVCAGRYEGARNRRREHDYQLSRGTVPLHPQSETENLFSGGRRCLLPLRHEEIRASAYRPAESTGAILYCFLIRTVYFERI